MAMVREGRGRDIRDGDHRHHEADSHRAMVGYDAHERRQNRAANDGSRHQPRNFIDPFRHAFERG